MDTKLLKPSELDALLRYPAGRSARLARAGKIPHIALPDGQIRFDRGTIDDWLHHCAAKAAKGVADD